MGIFMFGLILVLFYLVQDRFVMLGFCRNIQSWYRRPNVPMID